MRYLSVSLHNLSLYVVNSLREIQVERGLVSILSVVVNLEVDLKSVLAANGVLIQIAEIRQILVAS